MMLSTADKTRSSAIAYEPRDAKPAKDCWNGRGNDNLGWNDLQMYFKVIKSWTNRKLVYDFLLVVYSNFCRITHRFWEIWCKIVHWPWDMPKVIDSCITWKLSCGHVCKMFGRQWTNEAKIAIFNYPTLIWSPLSSEPYCQKLRSMGDIFVADSIWVALQMFEQFLPAR